jgi:hypothetical protein
LNADVNTVRSIVIAWLDSRRYSLTGPIKNASTKVNNGQNECAEERGVRGDERGHRQPGCCQALHEASGGFDRARSLEI